MQEINSLVNEILQGISTLFKWYLTFFYSFSNTKEEIKMNQRVPSSRTHCGGSSKSELFPHLERNTCFLLTECRKFYFWFSKNVK